MSRRRVVPGCDALEGRRLLSTTAHVKAKTVAVATTTTTSTSSSTSSSSSTSTQTGQGTTFASDLQKLRVDDQALVVDTQTDVYDALALQADIQALKAEATETPTPAVTSSFAAEVKSSESGFGSSTQYQAFLASFNAFLSAQGITDKALISKTISDQQALSRSLELPEADTTRVILDRRALANDLGFGADNASAILSAGPSASAALKLASKALAKTSALPRELA